MRRTTSQGAEPRITSTLIRVDWGGDMALNIIPLESSKPFDVLTSYNNGDQPACFPALEEEDGQYRWDQTCWPDSTISVLHNDGSSEIVYQDRR